MRVIVSNDAPAAAANFRVGDLVEAGLGTGGDAFATGNVLANDTDPDTADGDLQVTAVGTGAPGVAFAGTYGSVTIAANGDYTYILNNADADTHALVNGDFEFDVFSYLMTDAHGATSAADLTIEVLETTTPRWRRRTAIR